MDILEIEDVLKGLPDQALRQEAQQPSGQVPQYMVVSEIQRRSKMRKRFEAQQEQPSTTVAEQILTGGVASVAPPPPQMMGAMGMPQQPPAPPQQPPMGQQQPPMQPQQMPPQQPPMPQQGAPMPPPVQMAGGGVVKMAKGEQVPYSNPQGLIVQALEAGVPGSVLIEQNPIYADLINQLEAQLETKMGVSQYEDIKQDYIPYGREFDSDLASAPAGPMEEVVVTADRLPPLEPQGQITSRTLPQSSAVGPVAPTIDTGAENLLFDQPLVAEGFEKRTPQQEAISGFIDNLMTPDPIGELSGTKRRRARETAKGIAFEDLFPGRPSTGGQMRRNRRRLPDAETIDSPRTGAVDVAAAIARAEADPYNTGFDYSNIPGPGMTDVVVDPKQSAATQNDAIKLELDTATTKDPALLNMGLSEKSLTDYGYSDLSVPEMPEGFTLPKGTPDIQKQGIKYVSPEIPELVAPSFASLITEQERRLSKIKEDAKRDVSAQALINLGAGIMEGDVAGGLRSAGEAASKVRAAERAAVSDISNMQTRIKMAEEQGKFDTAKALRADALKEAQFEATFGLKAGELEQTLKIARERIASEGNTERGRALRARYNALNELVARMQAQGVYKNEEAINAQIKELQRLLGVEVKEAPSETGTSGFTVLSTE